MCPRLHIHVKDIAVLQFASLGRGNLVDTVGQYSRQDNVLNSSITCTVHDAVNDNRSDSML